MMSAEGQRAENPHWHYDSSGQVHSTTANNLEEVEGLIKNIDLGGYRRENVSNLSEQARPFFDAGLRLLLSYQHELAAHCFLASLQFSPNAVLAHGFVALCHSPNYNFKGHAYYESACHYDEINTPDNMCLFPSQQVADRHSAAGVAKAEQIKKLHKQAKKMKMTDLPDRISEVETQLLSAVQILAGSPGVDPGLSEELVGRPYADAMRKIYAKFQSRDAEVCYIFAESLMVLNAWNLFEYPTGKPLSDDVEEVRNVLDKSLTDFPSHVGLCHLLVHLSEMSSQPERALTACSKLRGTYAGHLVHMPSHIDVLIGDYEACVDYNCQAIQLDLKIMKLSPKTAGLASFYFGYIAHNFHMAAYGAILGGMEAKGTEIAKQLNTYINEATLAKHPTLGSYLETYAATEVHILIRFGRWKKLLEIEVPNDKNLMLYRTASIRFGRALAYAQLGNLAEARKEMDRFESFKNHPEAHTRILHNNTVFQLLLVDIAMLRGEVLYREGKHEAGLEYLRKAVTLQDNLNYDEPWGKMQPIRHALGGLLLEQNHVSEATEVFRADLKLHPKNPWALVGLIRCLQLSAECSCASELAELKDQLKQQRQQRWADFPVKVPCECCTKNKDEQC